MQFRLLVSSARIVLAVVVICLTVGGDPRPVERAAMTPRARAPMLTSRSAARESPSPPPATATVRATAPHAPTSAARGSPTRIRAESIELDSPVVEIGWRTSFADGEETVEWEVPDDAAGYHRGSAYPGDCGNTVISGHNDAGSGVFRRLIDLSAGDMVTLNVGETAYRYRVERKEILRQAGASREERSENARYIGPTDDERLTLVTCWPDTGNSHRLVILAHLVR